MDVNGIVRLLKTRVILSINLKLDDDNRVTQNLKFENIYYLPDSTNPLTRLYQKSSDRGENEVYKEGISPKMMEKLSILMWVNMNFHSTTIHTIGCMPCHKKSPTNDWME